MPTYAYACTSCGHELEVVQSMTDAALTECPQCSGALRKVFHPVGVAFKGSGFYRTDSRAADKPDSPAKPAGEKSGDSGGGTPGGTPSTATPAGSTTTTGKQPATTSPASSSGSTSTS